MKTYSCPLCRRPLVLCDDTGPYLIYSCTNCERGDIGDPPRAGGPECWSEPELKSLSETHKRRFRVTYEIVTPESAEHGDCEDHGFEDAQGFRHSVANEGNDRAVTIAASRGEFDLTLHQAADKVGCLEDSGSWLTEIDGRQDYRTGEHERLSLHPPRTITPRSYRRLCRALGAYR